MADRSTAPGRSRRARRAGCLSFAAVWLCVAALSITAGLLAARGDIVLQHSPLRQTRLWLVQEEGERGLGLSTARVVSGSEMGEAACVETRVRYLMWRTTQGAQPTQYCECYARREAPWAFSGPC